MKLLQGLPNPKLPDQEIRCSSFGKRAKLAKERGASLVEYCLLASLIAVFCVAAVQSFRERTTDLFILVASEMPGS